MISAPNTIHPTSNADLHAAVLSPPLASTVADLAASLHAKHVGLAASLSAALAIVSRSKGGVA